MEKFRVSIEGAEGGTFWRGRNVENIVFDVFVRIRFLCYSLRYQLILKRLADCKGWNYFEVFRKIYFKPILNSKEKFLADL